MSRLVILRGITGAGKTTLGKRLAQPPNGFTVMELDDVKLSKYGTTTKCTPNTDFPEFGRRVGHELRMGKDVVAIEAFVDKQHVDWFMNGVANSVPSDSIFVVWMQCDVATATQRKAGVLDPAVVKRQHARLPGRFHHLGELILDTTSLRPDETLNRVMKHMASS